LATACGREDNGAGVDVTMGRYTETDISPPIEGRFMSFLTYDGTIVAFDHGLRTKYSSADGGETWIQSPGPGIDTPRFSMVQVGAFLPDGRLLAYVQDEGLYMISPNGSYEHFPVAEIDDPIAAGQRVMVQLIEVLGNDRLLLSYNAITMMMPTVPVGDRGGDRVQGSPDEPAEDTDEYSQEEYEEEEEERPAFTGATDMTQGTTLHDLTTGALIAEMPLQMHSTAAGAVASDSHFYLLELFGSMGTISSFCLVTGTPTGLPAISLGTGMGGMISGFRMGGGIGMAINSYGELFVMHDDDLLHIVNGNIETLLDGSAFAFGSPVVNTNKLMKLADGSIVIGTMEGNHQSQLHRYVWDEYATINPERTLRVWSLTNNNFVRSAITELRRMYPDAYITYEIALDGGGGVSASDAIRTLNTQLLSGRGPDVLILDGTTVGNYVGTGMLLDLSGSISTGDMFENLLAPYILPRGAIYALPTQLLIPTLVGSQAAVNEIVSLEALVDRAVRGNPAPVLEMGGMWGGVPEEYRSELHFDTLNELFVTLWLTSKPAIIHNNQLDTDALRRFLAAVQAISDKYGLGEEGHFGGQIAFATSGGRGGMNVITGSLVHYLMHNTNQAVFSLGHMMTLQMLTQPGREDTQISPFPGLVPGVWQPSTIAGVSADTDVAPFAKQLINTMLSLEVQQINAGEGLPVTRAGITAQIEIINEPLREMEMPTMDFDVDAMITQLRTPAMDEATLREIIWGTVERLGSGTLDLEGAVREIEQNIRIYLAERS